MARIPPSLTVFLSFLFLLTLTLAHDLQNPFPEPKPQSEPVNRPEPKTQDGTVSFTVDTIDPVPLTFLRFRPINRHFHHVHPSPLPLSLRSGHRRCRHGHGHGLQIPYGNDAIVLDKASGRRIHPRWVTVHADAEVRSLTTAERFDSVREHHHRGQIHHQHREENSFAKKIRKFLNLF